MILGAMVGGWLDITDASGTRREALLPGLTRVGGGDADVPVPAAGADQLQVWDQPPRVVFVGVGPQPTLAGRPIEEAGLQVGDRIEWRGVSLVYGAGEAGANQAALEEIPAAQAAPVAGAAGPVEETIWRRLQAGMLVELDLADRVTARRWQDAVVRDAFDPDRCAADILARSAGSTGDDRMLQRSARLLRDLLMAPLLSGGRGATRRARQAARSGLAMVLSQLAAFVVYSLIVLAVLLLLRLKGVDFNALFDRMSFRG